MDLNSVDGKNDLRDFAGRYAAAWCSQDPTAVAAFFASNGSLRVNSDPPAVGRAAIAAVAQSFMSAFPDMQVLMDDLVIENAYATFHWTLVGTNTGSSGSGRPVRISGYEQWRIGSDGLIAESQGHFDANDYERQIGGAADAT